MLYERRQVAAKVESVEGTAETLAAADAKTLVFGAKIDFNPELLKRDPARSTYSNLTSLIGKRSGSLALSIELKGSGTPTTAPDWFKFMQACGCGVSVLKAITIGAVTSGPFVHGETVTGGTSSGKGRVIINTANGVTTLYYVVVSGIIQTGEVLTGGTSGATATTGSSPSTVGNVLEPLTDGVPTLTIGGYESGVRKLLKGCRGNAKFSFKAGEIVKIDMDFSGVEAGVTDLAMLSGISYEMTVPPVLLSAAMTVDAFAAKIGEMSIDLGNELAERDDISSSRGILSYRIGSRRTTGSFDPEMVLVATHDFFGKWFAGTEMAMDFQIGSVSGNKFRFFAPRAQYTKVSDESRNGNKIAKSEFQLNGLLDPGDVEWALISM